MPRDTSDLLHGTLDLLVLKALSTTPMHGFGLTKWIEQSAGNELEVVDSALYKALYRLEDKGLIEGRWVEKAGQRRRRYYRLTAAGRKTLGEQRSTWQRFFAALNKVTKFQRA